MNLFTQWITKTRRILVIRRFRRRVAIRPGIAKAMDHVMLDLDRRFDAVEEPAADDAEQLH